MRFALACTALALAGACAPAAGSERVVRIDIEHSAFDPALLTFERGETVRFVLRNSDPIDHEFIIGDEAVQDLHETGTEAHHGAKPGEVSIGAGESAETTYTFEEPGELIFGCHLPQHYKYGMRGAIEVR
ncbi:MAG TPA: plastocyanin/azurin family copper-binding protein [Actinomycetota bacterium]|nr:plastocyanin/azurin family copper-binding protein [Actinomycetota bacterium]